MQKKKIEFKVENDLLENELIGVRTALWKSIRNVDKRQNILIYCVLCECECIYTRMQWIIYFDLLELMYFLKYSI